MRGGAGIQRRLSLLGILPTGLAGFVLAVFFIQVRIADLARDLDFRGTWMVRELAAASVPSLASGDQTGLRRLVEATLRQEDVIEVGVFDAQGRRVESQDNWLEHGAEEPAAWTRTVPVFAPPDKANPNAPAEPLGSVKLVLSRGSLLRQRRDTVLSSLLALAGGLSLAALLARRMGRKISGPVMALTAAVHELSKGNLDVRVESDAEAELAYLQAGFNAMAAELKKSRQSLEQQVGEATSRLQEALGALEKRNQELEAARWLAEAQAELKSRFLAQMSHEIRTPMNGILGFAELLAQSPLHGEQAEQLGLIIRSAKNLLAVTNDILDLSKLEAGTISLDAQTFALRPCVEDIVALLAGKIRTPSVILWIDPTVPARVVGDPVRLQQVIANLLGNALKFTAQGRIVVRVRALPGTGRGHLLFSVSDSGGGISPQDMAKLFSPFLQWVERPAAAEKGSVLGLGIAKNIVERMGGKIHLASRVGRGSSFWFDVPLMPAQDRTEVPAPQTVVGLIEHDRLCRQALAAQLQSLGAKVEAFASLNRFLDRFGGAGHPPVLIYGLWPSREKADAALPRWLEWCEARQVKPILVFPSGERRLVGFHRKRGTVCLFHPLRSETLARAIAAQDSVGLPAPEVPAGQASLALRLGLRFLVADGNEINRLLLRAQLGRFGAEIVEARNGREALEQIRHQRFDLLFLDLQMPEMDGLQALREVRDNPGPNRHAVAIAVTAFCDPAQRESAACAGFADCLLKPISAGQLAQAVAAQLGDAPPSQGEIPSPEAYVLSIVGKVGGDWELASVVAHKLFAELPDGLRDAEAALRGQEREAAWQAAHKIHDAAAFAGLSGIREAAAALESALAAEADWQTLTSDCLELAREIGSFLSLESLVLDFLAQARRPGP